MLELVLVSVLLDPILGFILDGTPVEVISPNLGIDSSHRDCFGKGCQTSNEVFQ